MKTDQKQLVYVFTHSVQNSIPNEVPLLIYSADTDGTDCYPSVKLPPCSQVCQWVQCMNSNTMHPITHEIEH